MTTCETCGGDGEFLTNTGNDIISEPCPDCQKPDPIARLTGAKCLHRHGPIPSHPVDCAGGCKGTGRAYPWSVRECEGRGLSPGGERHNEHCCAGRKWVPLPDAELAMQVMGRAVLAGHYPCFFKRADVVVGQVIGCVFEGYRGDWLASGYADPLSDNPTIEQRIHAMTEAACAALIATEVK